MSLINPVYREQILDGIRADGVEVHEVVLTLPEEQLRVRIDADQLDVAARQWRHDHVARALTTFADVTGAHLVDASQPPDQVADAVAMSIRSAPSH
ncbi:hypothetical protein [Micromonospora sediminimaris]|uniref:Uncharacterized protein n=2 Tax=Micromonospora sediminimaris TaxID=547162 RepID=A0A9W5UMA8_9ACTN|nr:hypothetical protein [Micromonospora sediminimaris]GIJ31105.1 hypothetical protein Vse01_02530 [Micromonospora sediminimaris]SFC23255.1 hypothetical protein SAMN05216284_103257 [Micromonospora sediminimaris]